MFKFDRTSELTEDGWRYTTSITDDRGIHYAGAGSNVRMADHNALFAFAEGQTAPKWRKPIVLGYIFSGKEGNFEVIGIHDDLQQLTLKKIK